MVSIVTMGSSIAILLVEVKILFVKPSPFRLGLSGVRRSNLQQ